MRTVVRWHVDSRQASVSSIEAPRFDAGAGATGSRQHGLTRSSILCRFLLRDPRHAPAHGRPHPQGLSSAAIDGLSRTAVTFGCQLQIDGAVAGIIRPCCPPGLQPGWFDRAGSIGLVRSSCHSGFIHRPGSSAFSVSLIRKPEPLD